MPARAAMSSERAKNAVTSATMSIAGSAASRLFMTMTGTRCSATTRAMSGSRCSPHTSLTMAAPCPSAQAAISALIVSIETGTPRATAAGSTGASRSSSCSSDTGTAPPYGLVDSAPMSRMSAPSATSRCACAIAAAGLIKRPPSENESGVTLRTPITIGRPRPSSRCNGCGCGSARRSEAAGELMRLAWRKPPHASRRAMCFVAGWTQRQRPNSEWRIDRCGLCFPYSPLAIRHSLLVADLGRQFFGLLDPALYCFLGRQELHQLALLVGLGHGFGEPLGIAVLELAHGVDAGGADELGIVVAHPLDAHAISTVGPFEQALLVDPGLLRELLAPLQVLGRLEQPGRRADADAFELLRLLGSNSINYGDRIGHENLPAAARQDARGSVPRPADFVRRRTQT